MAASSDSADRELPCADVRRATDAVAGNHVQPSSSEEGQSSSVKSGGFNGTVNGQHDAATAEVEEPGNGVDEEPKETTKPSRLMQAWASLALDPGTLMFMAKGACGPVIALALFQYPPFAATFPTIGYLVAIAATISMPILPRAKFMQTMALNILCIAIGACVALLTCYSAVQARFHTSVPRETAHNGASGTQTAVEYNSSASAVAGIWLFFNILASNSLRFSRPQLQTPIILYSIFANISGTFAPIFGTVAQALAFVKMLLQAFLSGFAISTLVHFVVFPVSCRGVFFKQCGAYTKILKAILVKHRTYLEVMENDDMLDTAEPHEKQGKKSKKLSKAEDAAADVTKSLIDLSQLHSKLRADMLFVKREAAFGKLRAEDVDELFKRYREIFLALVGLASVSDIFTRVGKAHSWSHTSEASDQHAEANEENQVGREKEEWNEIMRALHRPFQDVTTVIIEGLEHATYVLEIEKPPKESQRAAQRSEDPPDVETAQAKKPGDHKFSEQLEAQLKKYNETRKAALRTWCIQRGIQLEDASTSPAEVSQKILEDSSSGKNRRQLYLILYMEHLLEATARSTHKLVKFADSKVEDGTMQRTRFIFPGRRRLYKWLKGMLDVEDATTDHSPDSAEAGVACFSLGDAYHARKDPEHLPPTNSTQQIGEKLRKSMEVLSQAEVAFGFRVACATMSIAILAYLQQTQTFFIEQRLVWAMIMVAIGMTMTTGAGTFGFLGRVFGTFIAMIVSLIIWYIAGGRGVPGASLPLLWIFIFVEMYFFIKFPRFIVVVVITVVTQILILGYELQVDKVGIKIATSNGQLYYPIYELAPYRLATVAAGCAIAFIWTYFPYPLTAQTALRRQLGEAVYLTANLYSCIHTSIGMRISRTGGDPNDKTSPAAKLLKARNKVVGKIIGLLSQVRQHADVVPLELTIGGRFPREKYDQMIQTTQHLLNYILLVDFSTQAWEVSGSETDESQWTKDLRQRAGNIEVSSQGITSLLILISSSLTNGTPLPPYLKAPQPYQLTEQIAQEDREILGLHHIMERGYAAFAVTQVASRLVDDDLAKLLDQTRDLVGEVDFSFHIVSTADAAASSSSSRTDSSLGWEREKTGKGKRD